MFTGLNIIKGGKPHVRFETKSVEDREESIRQGMKKSKDIDYVFVTPCGAKDDYVNTVEAWFKIIEDRSHIGQYEMEWIRDFKKMYELYKEGKEIPVEGTPLRMLVHLFSPSEVENCASLRIQTLEQLAAANEETLGRLGMGSREWKNRAQEALKLSEGKGDALKIAAIQTENNDLRTRISQLEQVIGQLQYASNRMPEFQTLKPLQEGEILKIEDHDGRKVEIIAKRGPGRPPKRK